MKKFCIIIIVTTLLLLTGCSSKRKEEENMVNNYTDIKYEEGIYQHKNWNLIEFPIEEVCVPDKETAISIAKGIILNFQEQGKFKEYIPQHVFFDTEDNFWIVSFWPSTGNDNIEYIGATFSIAIKKENAQVLKMWINE